MIADKDIPAILDDLVLTPNLIRVLTALGPKAKIAGIFKEKPGFKNKLKHHDAVKAAALVAGLLTNPSLHANNLRLESLIHLLLAFGRGKQTPTRKQLSTLLNSQLGSSSLSLKEDPAEDVFVSNVVSQHGNFRIFGGVWESNDFYLQRFVNIVESFPETDYHRTLQRQVLAILRLSEEIAARRGLGRFSDGGGEAQSSLNLPTEDELQTLAQSIKFSRDDLQRLEIEPIELAPFVLPVETFPKLADESLGDTDLERHPIVYDNDEWFVLLPNAISIAVRYHVIQWTINDCSQSSFNLKLVQEYREFLSDTPILGEIIPPGLGLTSKKVANKTLLEIFREVDDGRHLHLIAIVDGVSGNAEGSLSEPDEDFVEIEEQIERRITHVQSHLKSKLGFKHGLTLLVVCGFGRTIILRTPSGARDWYIETISAPDLAMVGWVPDASPLSLWKLLEYVRFLGNNGITFLNSNGLLNLYGLWSGTHFTMLPRDVIFDGEQKLVIPIRTDCLKEIRKTVRSGWNVHCLPLPNGAMVRVRRRSASHYFATDADKPDYVAIDTIEAGVLLAAWVGHQIIWWVTVEFQDTELSREIVYKLWETISVWLEKAVPVFEPIVGDNLKPAVMIALNFKECRDEQVVTPEACGLLDCIKISTDQVTKTIRLRFRDPFFRGFRNPKNIAERELVRALIMGVMELVGASQNEECVANLLDQIVPDDKARFVHFFEAGIFRDYIQHSDHPKSLFIDMSDYVPSKLGLGWQVCARNNNHTFTTAKESVMLLNQVVDVLWSRIRQRLHQLNRQSLIERSLRYIEGVEAEKSIWERTVLAVSALRGDKPSAKAVAAEEIARCTAATLALRMIVEMGLCECPLEGGASVGMLDLAPLMSDALSMFHLGGWSDAIHKKVMEPNITIAPNGEILSDVRFRESVAEPMGRDFVSYLLDYEASKYESHFQSHQVLQSVEGILSEEFLKAFKVEFAVSIDDIRAVRESLENLALEKRLCVFVARKSDILEYCEKNGLTNAQVATRVLEKFELWPRDSLEATPKGFFDKDWYPWRFGRQLSLVRRPLLRLDNTENPTYVISPGLFGQGFGYLLSRFLDAAVPVRECASREMKHWMGKESKRRGHAFAQEVFNAVHDLGYKALLEVELNALLNEKLELNFGDIDVLAWKDASQEILAIECKDLKLAKTPNEMAEQLNQFSGQASKDGNRDNLLKHLDRCAILNNKSLQLTRILGINQSDVTVKGVVCFSKQVPMQYVAKRFQSVRFLTIDELRRNGLEVAA